MNASRYNMIVLRTELAGPWLTTLLTFPPTATPTAARGGEA